MGLSSDFDVAVIGAGAAGLLAAARAAERGRRVLLLEKNTKAGVKILMSGGTRCNLTHAIDKRGIIDAFGGQGRFLHSPLAALPPERLIELVEAEGVPTKVEETGKVFPASDRAADVLHAFLRLVRKAGVTLALDEPVHEFRQHDGFELVTARRSIRVDKAIVTTGGQSFPGCGTTGDGYVWLRELGHTIVPPVPALVPITIHSDWAKALRGITIPRVRVKIVAHEEATPAQAQTLMETSGSMLFAHFGLTGPAILDASRAVTRHPRPRSLGVACDFLPDTTEQALLEQLQQWAARSGRKQLAGLLADRLPRRLIDALVMQSGLELEQRPADLSRKQRQSLIAALKNMEFPVTGTVGFKKAEVTAGGVALDDVDSRSMQSKRTANLFLAGELLDLDGPIGGYNFQAAFSTGWLAGESV